MFNLVYLYEQLKYQTAVDQYMTALNVYTEATCDTSKSKDDIHKTMKSIKEESEKHEAKLFDKRKKGVVTAKKLLSKFKATKQKKPYGLIHKEYTTFKTDEDIKKLHETAVNYLDQFNPATASDTEVKLFISDIESNKLYKGLCTIFGENSKVSLKDRLTVKKETKELTVDDIEEAASYMENFTEDCSKYHITRESVDTYGMDAERKAAANYKTALLGIADEKYYDMMSQKLTLEFAQASQVLTESMFYDPRNIKDSRVLMDEIAFLYEYTK